MIAFTENVRVWGIFLKIVKNENMTYIAGYPLKRCCWVLAE